MTQEEFFTVLEYVSDVIPEWKGEIPPFVVCAIMWDMFNEMSMDEFETHLTTRWQEIQKMTPQERIRQQMEIKKDLMHRYDMAESAENN